MSYLGQMQEYNNDSKIFGMGDTITKKPYFALSLCAYSEL